MKKILMIGGKGTISYSISKMLAKDPEVDLFLINRTERPDVLGDKVHRLIADVMQEPERVAEWIRDQQFDSVINFWIMNVEMAKRNLELFQGKTKQFIFISTVCVLDHQVSCNVNEEMPIGNRYSLYGQSKAACERYFEEEARTNGFPVTIVRPTQTYSGARIPLSIKGKTCWSVVSRMKRGKEVMIHGDGQGVWASTHADDFAPLFYPLIANEETIGETYHVMNPEPMTWDMIYQNLADLLGVEYRPVYISEYLLDASGTYAWKQTIHGDKHFSNIFDISKVKKFNPDYQAKIDIRTGLRMYLDFMDANPQLKVEEPDFDEWCDQTIALYKECMQKFQENIR